MRIRSNQSGFSVVELVIVAAVVAALGFVGYGVYNRQNNNKPANTGSTSQPSVSTQSARANDVASAPTISSTSDLDKASAVLNQTDPSGSNNADAGRLNAQLANF